MASASVELVILGRDLNKVRLYWRCRCDCGKELSARDDGLKCGDHVSCGCKKIDQLTEHGLSHLPEHKIWSSMIERCHTPNHRSFPDYGGRGIQVCQQWKVSFTNFLRDMGRRPSRHHSLDRFPDNDGDYGPSNCRWTIAKHQSRNRRNTKLTERAVEEIRSLRNSQPQRLIARRFGVSQSTIVSVLSGKSWQ